MLHPAHVQWIFLLLFKFGFDPALVRSNSTETKQKSWALCPVRKTSAILPYARLHCQRPSWEKWHRYRFNNRKVITWVKQKLCATSFIKSFSSLPQGVNFTYNLNIAIDLGRRHAAEKAGPLLLALEIKPSLPSHFYGWHFAQWFN